VEDPDGKIRWRVNDHCVPVDRSEWWLSRQERGGHDPTAIRTEHSWSDVPAGALAVVRRMLHDLSDEQVSDQEVLRRLGVLTPSGHLTQAGVLMFCAAERPLLTLARFDVSGGDVIGTFEPESGLSLIEQIAAVESRLDAFNPVNPRVRGLTEEPLRSLPPRAVREAVMNGLVHRDWLSPTPTAVVWIDADSHLEVVSPGGFSGGVTSNNILTQRHSRYPALADLFRALRLVDKQGVGVDRMYREMIVLGHRPPQIAEQPGPWVRTVLSGGSPVLPVVDLVRAIRPEVRQRDVRIAVLIHELLGRPFVSLARAAEILQSTELDARSALEAAEQTTVDGQRLVQAYKDVWILGDSAIARAQRGPASELARRGILRYIKPRADAVRNVAMHWLNEHDRITSGDYAVLTRTAQPNGTRVLSALSGDLLERGPGAGRNAHFVLRARRPGSSTGA
jgi:ATP-dependent DNA helicase RecG